MIGIYKHTRLTTKSDVYEAFVNPEDSFLGRSILQTNYSEFTHIYAGFVNEVQCVLLLLVHLPCGNLLLNFEFWNLIHYLSSPNNRDNFLFTLSWQCCSVRR